MIKYKGKNWVSLDELPKYKGKYNYNLDNFGSVTASSKKTGKLIYIMCPWWEGNNIIGTKVLQRKDFEIKK